MPPSSPTASSPLGEAANQGNGDSEEQHQEEQHTQPLETQPMHEMMSDTNADCATSAVESLQEEHNESDDEGGDDEDPTLLETQQVEDPAAATTEPVVHFPQPPIPHRSPASRRKCRVQSISRPSPRSLPPELPTLTTLLLDQLEYACYTVVASDLSTLSDATSLLTSILPLVWGNSSLSSFSTPSRICGRIFSRLQLAALSTDLAGAKPTWRAKDWKLLKGQVLFLRLIILRANANTMVYAGSSSEEEEDIEKLDPGLAEHDMMQQSVRQVVRLLETQGILAGLRGALHKDQTSVPKSLAKTRQQLVEVYGNDDRGVPEDLQPLVVGDLYDPKHEANRRDWETVKDNILEHVDRVVDEGEYSLETTIDMVGCECNFPRLFKSCSHKSVLFLSPGQIFVAAMGRIDPENTDIGATRVRRYSQSSH